jgi:signal transduction histidine kinase
VDPSTPIDVFEKLVNGLPDQIALLDVRWNIIASNDAWTDYCAAHGFEVFQVGHNYLEELERLNEEKREAARATDAVIAAIKEFEHGRPSMYRHVYSGPKDGQETQIRIASMEIGGRKYFTVTRIDVTELVQLRRLRQGFSTSLIHTQEEERRRMGREIHDSTMQQLSALGLAVSQLKRTRLPGEAFALVDDIEELLFDAQRELRSIAYLAHPPQLSRMELSDAMRTLVEGFGRRAGLMTSFEAEGETDMQWQNARVAIYRVLQEALSNVHRHAHATQLSVRLIGRKSMIHLIVADNGRGMPADVSPGVGLLGMRARLAELGGRLIMRPLSPGTAVIGSVQRT